MIYIPHPEFRYFDAQWYPGNPHADKFNSGLMANDHEIVSFKSKFTKAQSKFENKLGCVFSFVSEESNELAVQFVSSSNSNLWRQGIVFYYRLSMASTFAKPSVPKPTFEFAQWVIKELDPRGISGTDRYGLL